MANISSSAGNILQKTKDIYSNFKMGSSILIIGTKGDRYLDTKISLPKVTDVHNN